MVKIQRTPLYRAAFGHKRRGMEIQEAAEVDLDQVRRTFDLEVKTSSPDDHDVTNFVAKKGDKILGFAQLVRHSEANTLDNGYYLFSLNVRLLYRGLGIGRDLAQQVMTRAKREGATELSVITNEDNRTALGLFLELGFHMKRIASFGKEGKQNPSLQERRKVILAKSLVD